MQNAKKTKNKKQKETEKCLNVTNCARWCNLTQQTIHANQTPQQSFHLKPGLSSYVIKISGIPELVEDLDY